MNTEKAIRILQRRSTIPNNDYSWLEINQAIDMAINALMKKVPKEPKREILDLTDQGLDWLKYEVTYRCPECNAFIKSIDNTRDNDDWEVCCDRCGQRIYKTSVLFTNHLSNNRFKVK